MTSGYALRRRLRQRAATSPFAWHLHARLVDGRLTGLAASQRVRNLVRRSAHRVPIRGAVSPESIRWAHALGMPEASVVIPVHGHVDVTLRCLASVAAAGAQRSFEVIVVDDASDDLTAAALRRVSGIQLVRCDVNLGFQGATKRGVDASRGRVVVLLNNDTQVHPGWLDALLDRIDSHESIAAVGGRLVYPSGLLQEAGGAVANDGSAVNVGRFRDIGDPAYLHARDVDYCSAAALAIRRDRWDEVGGFDRRFAPAYYEDADLCFSLRARGYRVVYEPAAMVTHAEGVSHGRVPRRDGGNAGKSLQERHREVFADKWSAVLAGHRRPGDTALAIGLSRCERARVLLCADSVPQPNRDAGSRRTVEVLRLLTQLCDRVTLVSLDGRLPDEPTAALRRDGVEVLGGRRSLSRLALRGAGAPDLVVLSRTRVAGAMTARIRRTLPGSVVVFDTVDLESVRRERAARVLGADIEIARRAAILEERSMRAADVVATINDTEAAIVRRRLGDPAPVVVLPTVHRRRTQPAPGPQRRSGLAFVGGFQHEPNIDAVRHLLRDVMPAIRTRTRVQLTIVGAGPPAHLQTLAGPDDHFAGHVADLMATLDGIRVMVAPLRIGAGMKGKIAEAMAAGLPVVTTPIGAEGMDLVDGVHALVCPDVDSFAKAVWLLLTDDDMWRRIAAAAASHADERWSPAAMTRRLSALLEMARTSRGVEHARTAAEIRAQRQHCEPG